MTQKLTFISQAFRHHCTKPFTIYLSLSFLLPFLPLEAAEQSASDRAPRTFYLPLLEEAVKIDGNVEKPVYASIPWEKEFLNAGRWNHEYDSVDKLSVPGFGSAFRAATDGTYLYLAARLEEPTGETIASAKHNKAPLGRDDRLEIYLQANDDEADFYSITVTPRGVVAGKEFGQGGLVRADWETQTQVMVQHLSDAWTAEVAIPLHELKVQPELDTWRLQVVRYRAPRKEGDEIEISSWSPSPLSVDQPHGFGKMQLPEFARAVFGWELSAAPALVLYRDGKHVLQQEVTVENHTGAAREVVFTTILESDASSATGLQESQKFKIQDGASKAILTTLTSDDPFPFEGALQHTLASGKDADTRWAVLRENELPLYQYAQLVMVVPGYRNAIFATQKIDTLKAKILQLDPTLKFEPKASFIHQDAKIDPIAGEIKQIDEHQWEVTVPGIAACPDGNYTLRVELGDGKTLEEAIRKLPYREGEIWIDERGVVHRDGKPFPAYGYHYGRWRDLKKNLPEDLKINVFFPVIERGISREEILQGTLDLKEMGIFSGINSPSPSQESREKNELTEADREKYRALAEQYKDQPQVIAYYLSDEPEINGVKPALLEQVHAVYREVDPWRPTMVTNNTVNGVRHYQNGADIINPDPYPVFRMNRGSSRRINVSSRYLPEIITGEASYRARWVTPEAFWFHRVVGSRPPSSLDMRSQQVNAMIHGVTGFTWYREQAYWDCPGIQSSLGYLSKEYFALFPILTEGTREVLSLGEEIEGAWFQQGKSNVLMVLNARWEEREITVVDTRFAGAANWKELGNTRVHKGGSDRITLKMRPYESVILANEEFAFPADADWNAVEAREKTLIENSVVPGNIAHFSTGTKVKGIEIPPRSEPGLIAITDGMKDPRGYGFERGDFKSGIGVVFHFNAPRRPASIRFIGTNVRVGKVERLTSAGWEAAGSFHKRTSEPEWEMTLTEGEPTTQLRILFEALDKGKNTLSLHEIEIYEP